MPEKDFFDVPRTAVKTSEGSVDLPMLFDDVAGRFLNYFVETERVAPLLRGTGLIPCRFYNGNAMVSLIFYQYRKVGIGAYDEATVVIMVLPEGHPEPRSYLANFLRRSGARWTMGGYVLEMPVTLAAARAAGREIWGYPKFETRIPFRLSDREYEFSVLEPNNGGRIVSVKGSLGPGIRSRAFDFVTFSNHDDCILKTVVDVEGRFAACLNWGVKMEIGSVNHRMAQNLKALGLDRIQPFLVISGDSFRTRLNPGNPVAAWKTAPRPYAVEGEFEVATAAE
jgi:hypothetical protein